MKPSNIIISQGSRVVLVDFGISKQHEGNERADSSMAGTGAYAAPEQFIRGGVTDQRTDIYNLGITMYQMLYGRLPKGSTCEFKDTLSKIQAKLDAIIAKCVENSKEDRYQSVEEIRAELQAVRDMIIIGKARQRMLLKLETAAVIVLSTISYAVVALGLIN
jgi:serine/threonine-protein kinase